MTSEATGMPGVESRFAHYLYGKAPGWALAADQRFSYYAYVPRRLQGRVGPVSVVVVVHGTLRQPETYRNEFADFAEQQGCVVLAPLFPCGVVEPDDMDNYKRLKFHDIRFDLVLLAMLDEVRRRYALEAGPLYLHGFSGGGQFAHRFFYLHAEQLTAVSIGAPGAVTLLDDERDWWVGTRDVVEQFGKRVDLDALRRVRVMTVIGSEDFGGDEVTVPTTSRHWMPDANHAGADRQQRLVALQRNLERFGVSVEPVVVPGTGHRGRAVIPAVQEFFARVMRERAEGGRA